MILTYEEQLKQGNFSFLIQEQLGHLDAQPSDTEEAHIRFRLAQLYKVTAQYAHANAQIELGLQVLARGPHAPETLIKFTLEKIYIAQDQENVEPARALLEQVRSLLEVHHIESPRLRSQFHLSNARTHFILGDYHKAREFYELAVSGSKDLGSQGHYEYASALNGTAICNFALGHVDQAQPSLEAAIEIFNQHFPFTTEYADALQNLSTVFCATMRGDKADHLTQQSASLRKRLWGEDHPRLAGTYNSLALRAQDQHDLDAAIAYCLKAVELAASPLSGTQRQRSIMLTNLGQMYRDAGKRNDSRATLQLAIQVAIEMFGPEHYHVSKPELNLALLEREEARYVEAKEIASRVLARELQRVPQNTLLLSEVLSIIGSLSDSLNDHEAAISALTQAIEFKRQTFGAHSSYVFLALLDLANVCMRSGALAKARQFLNEARTLFSRPLTQEEEDAVQLFSGRLSFEDGDYRSCIKIYRALLERTKPALTLNQVEIAASLNNLALSYSNTRSFEKAERTFTTLLTHIQSEGYPHDQSTALMIANYAEISESTGEVSRAKELYELSDERARSLGGDLEIARVLPLIGLARLALRAKAPARGLQYCTQALEIVTHSGEVGGLQGGLTHFIMGTCLSAEEQFTAARESFEKADTIWKTVLPPQHTHRISLATSLAALDHLERAKKEGRDLSVVATVSTVSKTNRLWPFLASMFLFAVLFLPGRTPSTVLLVVGVLVLHELGHLLAMRFFNYQQLQILFIPFLGAVALGKNTNQKYSVWEEVLIALSGPLPGIFLALVLWVFSALFSGVLPHGLLSLLLVLNTANLLPLLPLDGGFVVSALFFSQNILAQLIFGLVGSLGIFFCGLYLDSYLLMIFGIWLTYGAANAHKEFSTLAPFEKALSSDLAKQVLPKDPKDLWQFVQARLDVVAGSALSKISRDTLIMLVLRKIHASDIKRSTRLMLMFVYGATLLIGIYLSSALGIHSR